MGAIKILARIDGHGSAAQQQQYKGKMWILTGHFCRNLIVTPKHKDKLVFSGDAMNKVGGEMTLFKSAHGLVE